MFFSHIKLYQHFNDLFILPSQTDQKPLHVSPPVSAPHFPECLGVSVTLGLGSLLALARLM